MKLRPHYQLVILQLQSSVCVSIHKYFWVDIAFPRYISSYFVKSSIRLAPISLVEVFFCIQCVRTYVHAMNLNWFLLPPSFVLATSTTSSARSCCCVKLHSRRHVTWPGFTFLWPVCAIEPHLFLFRFDHSIFPSRSVCRKSCDFILIQSRAISGGSVEWNLKEAQPFWHDEKLHFSLSLTIHSSTAKLI